jgi:hypothetical protein
VRDHCRAGSCPLTSCCCWSSQKQPASYGRQFHLTILTVAELVAANIPAAGVTWDQRLFVSRWGTKRERIQQRSPAARSGFRASLRPLRSPVNRRGKTPWELRLLFPKSLASATCLSSAYNDLKLIMCRPGVHNKRRKARPANQQRELGKFNPAICSQSFVWFSRLIAVAWEPKGD